MTVISHRLRLAYEPIPKNACTSAKSMLFWADTGRRYDPRQQCQGKYIEIHNLYPSIADGGRVEDWLAHYDRVVILRDPIARFISGFRNRILHFRDIESHAARDAKVSARLLQSGLPAVPDVNIFAEHLAAYMEISGIVWHHFVPQIKFVDKIRSAISHAFDVDRLGEFRSYLAGRSGIEIDLLALQTAGRKVEVAEIDTKNLAGIRNYYAEDYRLLDGFGIPYSHAAEHP